MACLQERGKVLLEATVKAKSGIAFRPHIGRTQKGFSLIEVMISMVILMVGLISLLGVFGIAMAATQTSQLNGTAKQLANESIESILTARETANVTWTQIQNTGSGGLFLPGFQPIDCAGVDGIVGTADDAACGPQILEQPGPTGVFAGNCPLAGPDTCLTLTNFQRQILISPVFPPTGGPIPIATLRAITITIQYQTPQFKVPRQYVLNTYISEYR
jgi:prepilin-type N-terminal cleavage/methylation domain-containing protein